MQIFVKTLSGRTITIQIEEDDYIFDLRNHIYLQTGIPEIKQGLVWNCKSRYHDHLKVKDFGVLREATFHLMTWPNSDNSLKFYIDNHFPIGENKVVDTPILIRFSKRNIDDIIDLEKVIIVHSKKLGAEIPGKKVFEAKEKTLTFVPNDRLPYGDEINVTVIPNYVKAINGRPMNEGQDFKFKFNTIYCNKVDIIFLDKDSNRHKIFFDCYGVTNPLFELRTRMKQKVKRDVGDLFASEVPLEDDEDVLNLLSGEVVEEK